MEARSPKIEKWTNPQIELLIDAYKEEICLYATTKANYHNKHLRKQALERVSASVKTLRPTTTPAECQNKFHNLRNQFNVEHAKVRASHKSGTGADNIYQPTLWYYQKLLFLETYVKPRKSRNSLEQIEMSSAAQQHTASSTIENDSQHSQLFEGTDHTYHHIGVNLEIYEESSIASDIGDECIVMDATTPNNINPSLTLASSASPSTSISDTPQVRPTFIPPGPGSPAFSVSSSSGISTVSQRKSKKIKKHDSCDGDYAGAIHELAESMKQPITINTIQNPSNMSTSRSDPVDTFINFIGSLLRTFQDEELKLDLMNNITQIVIDAKSTDFQQSKK